MRRARFHGFSLLEVVFAVALFAVGVVASLALFTPVAGTATPTSEFSILPDAAVVTPKPTLHSHPNTHNITHTCLSLSLSLTHTPASPSHLVVHALVVNALDHTVPRHR